MTTDFYIASRYERVAGHTFNDYNILSALILIISSAPYRKYCLLPARYKIREPVKNAAPYQTTSYT